LTLRDEIWSFVAKKQRNVRVEDPDEFGDAWVFVAMDAQTKLIPAYAVGKRDRATTYAFLTDLRDRMAEEHRFQITTDGFIYYRRGVEDVFAGQADFAQITKIYGDYGQHDAAGRYWTLLAVSDDRNHSQDTGRTPRPAPHLHQLRRTAEPHDSHGNPALHALNQCVFKEAGQSQSRLRFALRVLQFLSDTQVIAGDASDGSGIDRSHMDAGRIVSVVYCSPSERRSTILVWQRRSQIKSLTSPAKAPYLLHSGLSTSGSTFPNLEKHI
jgi:hypothetical protein